MSQMLDRIIWNTNQFPDKRAIAQYGDIAEIPTVHVQIHPGVVMLQQMEPIITADGAPIAATGYGRWGHLYAVGNPKARGGY